MAKTNHVGKGARGGFTLVELLVVITIIGILMGLLIPAVNAARETARRNQCSTQINNLAKAAIQYEMAKKQFPGWLNDFGTFAGSSDPSDPELTPATYARHKKLGTWVVSLLPSLDAQPTYEVWTQDKYPVIVTSGSARFTTNAAPSLAIMQCPSSTTLDGDFARNSYVANAGMHHRNAANGDINRSNSNEPTIPTGGSPTTTLVTLATSMAKDNGVFNNKYAGTDEVAVGPAVRLDDFKDGQGNTVLFSENLQAVPWTQVHPLTATSITALGLAAAPATDVAYPSFSRFPQGFVWHYEDTATPNGFNGAPTLSTSQARLINSPQDGEDKFITRMTEANAAAVARPSSAHNDGVNMGFADGASKFIADSIDYRVYQALMTPRGKSSLVPFREYVLKGESL
jgi:prepilin-type N-terminal cleavage/methylation domain-containing protein/prepilin-type processing-associated H-X9-DG protein